jgi:hypothetical protein
MSLNQMGGGFKCFHRWSAPHHITKDRSKWLRTCRNCETSIVSWFDEELGEIVEKIEELPLESNIIHKSI